MNDKKLPIKFFEKREIDQLKVEGGGNSKDPKFVSLSLAESKYERLRKRLEDIKDIMIKKESFSLGIPFTFKVKMVEESKAKTHRRKVGDFFRVANNNVLGLDGENEFIVKIESEEESEKMIARMNDYQRFYYPISCIEDIEEFKTHFSGSEDIFDDYKFKLINYQNKEQNNRIRSLFEQEISDLGIEFKETNYSSDFIIYKIRNINLESFEKIKNDFIFDSIFSIEPMPKYTVSLDNIEEEEEIEIIKPKENKEYTTIGILDNGISDIPYLKPWLNGRFSPYPEDYMKKDHGTFVSGVAVYGDLLEDKSWIGEDGVRIFDACIFPDIEKESIDEDELIENINEVIEKYSESIKIWNLSISIAKQVDEFSFSDFGVALDEIQQKNKVLIIKSAGNCKKFKYNKPVGKIHYGADSVRAITVGSLAHKKSSGDLADIDNRSPFSRIGRGPSYIIKPELVHYGGNAGLKTKSGVKSFGKDGGINQAIGTSFSTPRIASLAARIYQEINEEFDPLLIKGLMIHSADYSKNLKVEGDRVDHVGFGRPKRVKEILFNSVNEATLIIRDNLEKSEYIDIMDFPMPECLIDEDGFYNGQIIVTLVYDPILEPTQRAEYCQSNIEVKMGTYDRKKDRNTDEKNILNPIGREGSRNILLESNYSKRNNEDDFSLEEKVLIKYGDKYYPVKKYAIDLSQTTKGIKNKHLTGDKKWFLKLHGVYRQHVETNYENEELNQNFCLIVTVRDPEGIKPVYDGVTQKLNEYNFIHNNIKTNIDISINN
jgi:hypothetical protein